MGRTGDPPVPFGDPPNGTIVTDIDDPKAEISKAESRNAGDHGWNRMHTDG